MDWKTMGSTLPFYLSRFWHPAHRLLKAVSSPPSPSAFRILIFHAVPPGDHALFADFLRYVRDAHGILTPAQAEARLLGQPFTRPTGTGPPCLVTFDDGFRSNFHVAERILSRYGVQAIFFVCPGLVDLPAAEQRKKILENIHEGRFSGVPEPLMSWQQIETLLSRGHAIGSHTLTHQRLSALPLPAIEQEIGRAEVRLSGQLGQACRWFAYPFGDIGSIKGQALQVVARHHAFCCSGIRGLNDSRTPALGLLREHIDLHAPPLYQRMSVDGALDLRYRSARRRLGNMLTEADAE